MISLMEVLEQQLDGTYADASDLLDLNRQFLIDEVLSESKLQLCRIFTY